MEGESQDRRMKVRTTIYRPTRKVINNVRIKGNNESLIIEFMMII